MNIIRTALKITSITFLYLFMGFVFSGNHKWMVILVLIGSFFISYLVFKKEEASPILNGIILILPLITILTFISLFSNFTYSLTYILFLPLSCILAYLFYKKKSILIILFTILSFSFASFVFFPNLLVYNQNNKFNKNTTIKNLALIDKEGNSIKIDSTKITVLDFWTTSCKNCFKSFPEFEKVYLKYNENQNIEFYSINVPIKNDTLKKTISIVEKLNYKYPTLFYLPEKSHDELSNYGIISFPHLLIVKNNKIKYSGRMETDPFIFINNIYNEINKNLY